MMLAATAAMKVERASVTSSYSLFTLIDEESSRSGIPSEIITIEYEKLYPGKLWPTTYKTKKAGK